MSKESWMLESSPELVRGAQHAQYLAQDVFRYSSHSQLCMGLPL